MIQRRSQDNLKRCTQQLKQALYAVKWKYDEAAQVNESGNCKCVNTVLPYMRP